MKTPIAFCLAVCLQAQSGPDSNKPPSSYMPVKIDESFSSIMTRMKATKAEIMKRQLALLEQRYDLRNHAAQAVTMSRGKSVQDGVRVKLPKDVTWQSLNQMTPDEIRSKDSFPIGFMPLPHANHPEGGMNFP